MAVREIPPDPEALNLPRFPPNRFEFELPSKSEHEAASVVRAWDHQLERGVACKRAIDPAVFNLFGAEDFAAVGVSESMQDQLPVLAALNRRYTLVREARLMALVDHPNVMPVLDIGRIEDHLIVLVLPYLGGGTAATRKFPKPWEQVLEIALQIGRGLEAIHEAGILHRDIKPANILFDSKGRPRVADIGLGCLMTDFEALAEVVGTRAYMPPGVFEYGHQDVRDDLYAYCMVVYEMFYGRRPFDSDEDRDRGRVAKATREGGMPRRLHAILEKGLAPDPEDRWPSMSVLLTKMERVRRPTRRRWPLAAGGLGLAASFAIGMLMASRPVQADECEEVTEELEWVWNNEVRAEMRGAFGTRKAGDGLQDWATRWLAVRAQECEAAKRDEQSKPGPTPCSAVVRDRFQATVQAFRTPHLREGLSFATVIAELPAPEYCLDHPEDTEWGYGGLLELRNIDVEVEAVVRLGDLEVARERARRYMELSQQHNYRYGIARAMFWHAELLRLEGEIEQAKKVFEAAYEDAWALGAGVFGAEVQTKLAAVAGAQGDVGAVDAFALSARGVFAGYEPSRVAEVLQVQGLALVEGSEQTRERGVGLLLRAVEMREAQFEEYKGTRELVSQAHENYARGLLAVGRASEALEYLERALRVHQEEFGHGTWRTRGILRQKFRALVKSGRLNATTATWRTVLKLDADAENWKRYADDAYWFGDAYRRAGHPARAALALRAGQDMATQHQLADDVARFDAAILELLGESK
jgi:tRNA A-37 threonylcarbamoyl transferase component Bud32/tetratricopeptide (TPR) repeat protein